MNLLTKNTIKLRFCGCSLMLLLLIGCSTEANNKNGIEIKQAENNVVQAISFPTTLSPNDYENWVKSSKNNPLIREKKINEFDYKVKHLPTNYLVLKEINKNNLTLSKETIDSIKKEYEGMEYFEMRIQVENYNDELAKYMAAGMADYQTRIVYMAFQMQHNLTLATELNADIPCKLFHFERTYGITPYATFLFAFSKQDIGNAVERTVIYEDELFNKGRLKFNWAFNYIELPKIAIL